MSPPTCLLIWDIWLGDCIRSRLRGMRSHPAFTSLQITRCSPPHPSLHPLLCLVWAQRLSETIRALLVPRHPVKVWDHAPAWAHFCFKSSSGTEDTPGPSPLRPVPSPSPAQGPCRFPRGKVPAVRSRWQSSQGTGVTPSVSLTEGEMPGHLFTARDDVRTLAGGQGLGGGG